MRRLIREESPDVMSEINITPLTDMALVLLIIFMVTTPLILQGGIKVKLPSAATADMKEEASITVTLTLDNKLYVNEELTNMDMLLRTISDRVKNIKNPILIINADQGVTHGQVVRILDTAKKAGIVRLAIAAERIGEKELLKGK